MRSEDKLAPYAVRLPYSGFCQRVVNQQRARGGLSSNGVPEMLLPNRHNGPLGHEVHPLRPSIAATG